MPLVKPAWPILQRGDPLSVGLVAAYPFHEGGGNTLSDLSGNRNNGAITSGQVWIGSQFGSALSFNGSSQQITVANAASLNPSFITIAALVRSNSASGGQFVVNKNYDGGSVAYSLCIGGAAGFGDGIQFFAGGWHFSGITTDIRGDNKWHLVGGTYDQLNLKYYMDGKLDASAADTTALPTNNTQPLYIGEYVNDGAYFQGDIALVLLWNNRVLNADEFARLNLDPFAPLRPKRRVPWFTLSGGAGTQNLSPSLFTNTNTFFSLVVAAGTVNLTPGLFTDSDTFFAPTIGRGAVTLTLGLFTDADTFYSPTVTVAGAQALAPTLFTNQGIFYLPIVHSRVVLVNVWVRLTELHEFDARVWSKDTVFGPDQATVPSDFNYTPLMEGYSAESQTAIAQVKIDVWGRYDSHGNLLDNPPIPRPIYDPQPTPAVGNKHLLPLGNTC